MKSFFSLLAVFLLFSSALQAQDEPELPIGSAAPHATTPLATTEGGTVTLDGLKGANGLLVVFTSNTCPWVHRWESRYLELADLAKSEDIPMIALNPNEAARGEGESMQDMIKRAKDFRYNFVYAMDKDHKLATAFGANRTPHVYLFDSEMKLVYRGAIDDNARDAAAVQVSYAKQAVTQLAAGEEISVKTSTSLGCTIKWLTD
jgi:opacity protein-like surface antigen